jgi:tetratricopeptide (TPR) repeat protein
MPRLKDYLAASTSQQGTFVGRARELSEFRNCIRYTLGTDSSVSANALYPHLFLLSGEGGMGKSALLRQFVRVAQEEGLLTERIVLIDLDYHRFPTVDLLAQCIADTFRHKFPDFDLAYRKTCARREMLLPRYRELQSQWATWEAMRGGEDTDLDALLDAHRRTLRKTEIQRAQFGANEPTYLAIQSEEVTRKLTALLAFCDEHGYIPHSLGDLLERELQNDALLFQGSEALGQSLADDLYALAEHEPLLLAIDTYELADQHDDWLRTTILANSSNRMLTIIAGRNRHGESYRRTFSGNLTGLVSSYNLNDQALQPSDIRDYLRVRLLIEPPQELVEEVHAISHGVPVALEAIGDQLVSGGDLEPYRGMELASLDLRAVMHSVTTRFLRYALDDKRDDDRIREQKLRDRRFIRMLSLLLRPDAELACALWGVSVDEGSKILTELTNRYSFIFSGYGPYGLHDLVREFVRADTLADGRSSFDWPPIEAGLERVRSLVERRLSTAEQMIANVEARYAHFGWCEATLDRINVYLWLGQENIARKLLLRCWIESQRLNPPFAVSLISLGAALAPQTSDWTSLIQALHEIGKDAALLYALLNCEEAYSAASARRQEQSSLGNVTDVRIELLDCYSRMLKIHPGNARILNSRGVTKMQIGDLTGAIIDFEQAHQSDPKFASPTYNMACVYAVQGQAKLAFDWLARGIEMSERYRETARNDPDFASIRTHPEFVALVGDEEELKEKAV